MIKMDTHVEQGRACEAFLTAHTLCSNREVLLIDWDLQQPSLIDIQASLFTNLCV